MTTNDIIKYRLINQQLAGTKFTGVKQLVSYMGAVQAQDYAMAKWAIGIRLPVTEEAIEDALNKGEIVRTHVLRPTWHFVAVEDIGWMLKLTAPHVKATYTSMSRKLELDSKVFNKSNTIIEKLLSNGEHLTRNEIMLALNKKGIVTDDIRSTLIMMNAELDGLVYNGKRRGKQFTYSLLDNKVAHPEKFTKDEALTELAKRYFISHGPATLHDFAWWSGLSVTNAKAGLESVKSLLLEGKTDGKSYWFADSVSYKKKMPNAIHFLPAYDEFMVGYSDRSATLDSNTAKLNITAFQFLSPDIIMNGKLVGTWKRTFKKDTVIIETHFLQKVSKEEEQVIFRAAEPYGKFFGMKVVIR